MIKGDYVIEKKLGSGGFGSVYLAKHRFLGSIHVIKRLHEQYASDPEYVSKFMNEGRAVRRLKGCPYVVEVEHMTQSEDGHLILVMEHVAGGDLDALMQSREMTIAEVIESGRQISLGLDAAHRAGLIHRDIKPQNVLIGQDSFGRPLLKLIDFGLVKDRGAQEKTSVMRGGSLGYTAPEQWMRAGKDIDGRADLYSLGASMYRMLCGRMPHDSSDDVMPWMARVAQAAPPAPAAIRGDCPAALSNLILELLAIEPEGRPMDAAAVIRRLEAITAIPQAAEVTRLMPPLPEKRPRPWPAAVAAAAVILGVGGWIATRPNPAPPAPATAKTVEPPVTNPVQPSPIQAFTEPAPSTIRPPEEKKKPAVTPVKEPEIAKPEPPKPEPINHAALGDAARNAGDLATALRHYREAADPTRLAAVQRAVEGDAEERASALMDRGQFADALKIVDRWLPDFAGSQRLQRLRARIVKARDSQ